VSSAILQETERGQTLTRPRLPSLTLTSTLEAQLRTTKLPADNNPRSSSRRVTTPVQPRSRQYTRNNGWRRQSSVSIVFLNGTRAELMLFSYPKHVWSPAGGWYAQPANWKANTAVMMAVCVGITAIAWNVSAKKEIRPRMPEEGRFYPSR
jgi:hypothetical protein